MAFDRRRFERLMDEYRFAEARDELDQMPPGRGKMDLTDMLFRVWGYCERVGTPTMFNRSGEPNGRDQLR